MEPFEELEARFGEFLGVENVVACSSGTAALVLALEALQLPQGSQVLVPDLTMVACARAVTIAGLEPVFVDCGDDLLMNPEIATTIDPYILAGKVSAVMAVHVYGRVCNMDLISQDAFDYGQAIVEDLAEAHGVKPHPLTDAACWSHYKNKTIGGEEGGTVSFPQEKKYADRARSLRSLGFTADHNFYHNPRGHNYRLANALAKPILESLAIFSTVDAMKRTLEAAYDEACPAEWRMLKRQAPWVYDFRVPGMTSEQQTRAVRKLQAIGVPARHCFKPMSEQPEYRHCKVYGRGNALRLSREVIYVPFSMNLGFREARIFETVKSAL